MRLEARMSVMCTTRRPALTPQPDWKCMVHNRVKLRYCKYQAEFCCARTMFPVRLVRQCLGASHQVAAPRCLYTLMSVEILSVDYICR